MDVKLVESAAKARGEIPVPREFIEMAIQMIERHEVQVERYPTGAPSLKSVFEVATKLHAENSPLQ